MPSGVISPAGVTVEVPDFRSPDSKSTSMPALSLQLEKPDLSEISTSIPVVMQPSSVEKTPRNKTKWVAIATIVVSLIVVAGFVAAFCFMYKTSEAAIKTANLRFKGNEGEDIDETVEAYDDDTIMYTMTDQKGKQTVVIEDYGKKLEVSKMRVDDMTVCYVTPLNKTKPLSLANIDHNVDDNMEDQNNEYEVATDPVSDPSFLGPKALTACKGSPVYWVQPKCADGNELDIDSETGLQRSKRATFSVPASWLPLPSGHQCKHGCCLLVCCCAADGYSYVSGGTRYCRFYCSRTCSSSRVANGRYC